MTSLRTLLIDALDGVTVIIDRRPRDQRDGPFGGGWHGPLDNPEEVADHILAALPNLELSP